MSLLSPIVIKINNSKEIISPREKWNEFEVIMLFSRVINEFMNSNTQINNVLYLWLSCFTILEDVVIWW